jgi:hypothetical protein
MAEPTTTWEALAGGGLTFDTAKGAATTARSAVQATGKPYYVSGTGASGYSIQPQYTTSSGQAVSNLQQTGGGDVSRIDQLRNIGKDLNPPQLTELQNLEANSVSAEDRYRSEISSAWDGYIASLDQQGQYIDQQTAAQRGIADNTFNQNNSEIDAGKTRSLKDLQSTARNALAAGNNYLGSLGAGDSSANAMFNYAINKDQLKQVGDLNNFVMGQKQKLKTDYDNQILGIQNWFAQQQQALQQAKSQGTLQKGLDLASLSKDLLNNALQAVAQAKADAVNRQNLLLEWAVNNSANQAGVQSTLNSMANNFNPNIQTSGMSNGGLQFGGNVATNEDPNKLY